MTLQEGVAGSNRGSREATPETPRVNPPQSCLSGETRENRTVQGLICDMMVRRGELWLGVPDEEFQAEKDLALAAELEAELHDVLKSRYLGVLFNWNPEVVFWVDEHTPPGKVKVAEPIDRWDTPAY